MILSVTNMFASNVAAASVSSQSEKTVYTMDEAAFEAFYRRNARPLWGYIARISGDANLADEILQNAFFRFLRTPLTSSDESQLRGLVYKIATNLVHDEWRRKKKENPHGATAAEEPMIMSNDDLRHDVAKVFRDLNPQERALLWLAHVDGSPHEEIAERLGVKTASVKVLLFRARKKLGGLLQRSGIGPEVIR